MNDDAIQSIKTLWEDLKQQPGPDIWWSGYRKFVRSHDKRKINIKYWYREVAMRVSVNQWYFLVIRELDAFSKDGKIRGFCYEEDPRTAWVYASYRLEALAQMLTGTDKDYFEQLGHIARLIVKALDQDLIV